MSPIADGADRAGPDSGGAGDAASRSRGAVIGSGGKWLAKWGLRLVLIAAGGWVLWFVLSKLWVIVLPVLLAVVLATVLWPPTRWMIDHRIAPAVSAAVSMLGFLLVFAGLIALIAPSLVSQSSALADRAVEGIGKVQNWLIGPPLNIEPDQIDHAIEAITHKVQSSASTIAEGVFSGVTAAGSALVTGVLVLVLTFFFIKDGRRFLPWMHRSTGSPAARHFEEVLRRMWNTLGGFIRTQALVSLIDAFFIGIGLIVLGVPLAGPLIVITFIGGFVPIVGAFVAGALAVLVALVAKGLTTALIVLAVILLVQQLEGNVLSPMLQSRSMQLHPVVVLLSVTAGGSLFGIIGAFLAVPVAAVGAVVIRYLDEIVTAHTAEAAVPSGGDGPVRVSGDEPVGDTADETPPDNR
ncbi:AI-2E family transporter [Rhodococcus sp. D2-41]|uniref:AI-2E family transporter n=1 Tax=Speluncibacter jeojiensis TaxID=2710754 RepID=A0A9X4M0P9_9ACTN|nr:AI-2E family transporter [Rhodococcus sp. D2-41]MDG3012356.1 AI-2E family transporter [Rhodococcus sp. D2-41]MDG3014669.1 AI-2E family transporter [Corynebacteriales bacterium D3-21]